MDETTLYEIFFRYCDNGEIYQLKARLTDPECKRISRFLAKLLAARCIKAADETDSDTIENVIYEPARRRPLTFTGLKDMWKGGTLMRMAGENSIQI